MSHLHIDDPSLPIARRTRSGRIRILRVWDSLRQRAASSSSSAAGGGYGGAYWLEKKEPSSLQMYTAEQLPPHGLDRSYWTVCPVCKIKFRKDKAYSRGRHCSMMCSDKAVRVCETCKKSFTRFEAKTLGDYCSTACGHASVVVPMF